MVLRRVDVELSAHVTRIGEEAHSFKLPPDEAAQRPKAGPFSIRLVERNDSRRFAAQKAGLFCSVCLQNAGGMLFIVRRGTAKYDEGLPIWQTLTIV